jgi:hypothetical protein
MRAYFDIACYQNIWLIWAAQIYMSFIGQFIHLTTVAQVCVCRLVDNLQHVGHVAAIELEQHNLFIMLIHVRSSAQHAYTAYMNAAGSTFSVSSCIR